jgi:hypothetical protein
VRGPSKRELLAQAFRAAGPRGLTRREIQQIVGVQHYRRRLAELEAEGLEFRTDASRFDRHRTWRWVLTGDPERIRAFLDAPSAQDLAVQVHDEPELLQVPLFSGEGEAA